MARFHTGFGKYVGWSQLHRGIQSLFQAIIRKTTGQYPLLPWIPWNAIHALNRIIQPTWYVWEIGAGMSTIWLASRAGKVTSLESRKEWMDRVSNILEKHHLTNVDLHQVNHEDQMDDFSSVPDQSIDLLFIDSGSRVSILRNGFCKVKPGGYIFMDNWDSPAMWLGADDFFKEHNSEINNSWTFANYAPGSFGVFESRLLQKKEESQLS